MKNTIGVYTGTTVAQGYKAQLVKAFADGVNCQGNENWQAILTEEKEVQKQYSHAFCFGYQRGSPPRNRKGLVLRKNLITHYGPTKNIWYYDSDVLVSYEKTRQHPRASYVRIAYGNIYPDKTKYFNENPKSERWEKMAKDNDIVLKDYNKTGRKIYICCNRGSEGYSGHGVNAAEWAIKTAKKLRKYTDRFIVVRTHSGMGYPSAQEDIRKLYDAKKYIRDFDVHSPNNNFPNLIREIQDSYAVVIFTSSAGAPAVIEGKPLFVTHKSGYLTPMNAGTLDMIEKPNYDLDREKFLHGLGESHWSLVDIEQGKYFKRFLERNND